MVNDSRTNIGTIILKILLKISIANESDMKKIYVADIDEFINNQLEFKVIMKLQKKSKKIIPTSLMPTSFSNIV